MDRLSSRGAPCRASRRLTFALGIALAGAPATCPATDDLIAALVARVSKDSLNARVIDLEGFETRRADTPQANHAANWIATLFAADGADSVAVQRWSHGFAPNTVAIRRGTVRPHQVVLIGGHFDSISRTGQSAPGADDNGSGTAAVLECARVLCGSRFENTLQFAAFSAEEFGLVGSDFYAASMAEGADTLIAMINVDMIGYRAPGDRRDLDIISDLPSAWLRDAAFQSAATWVPELPLVNGSYPPRASSDHASFWAWGWNAIAFFEDSQSSSPYLHTSNDLYGLSYNDDELASLSTRVAVALLASLARPVTVSVMVQDLEAHAGPGSVALAWRLASDASPGLTGVRVQRAAAAPGPYVDRTPVPLLPAPTMRWVDVDPPPEDEIWYRLVLVDRHGDVEVTSPVAARSAAATTFLAARTRSDGEAVEIRYSLGSGPAATELALYDAAGRQVRRLASSIQAPGSYLRTWDRRDEAGARVARGVYLVHLQTGGFRVTRKLVLLH